MKSPNTSPSPDVATEVLQYLLRNPAAEDTVEGIVHWWLVEERLMEAVSEVRNALARLQQNGFITIRTLADGRVLYRLNPARHEAAEAALSRVQEPSKAQA